MMKIYRWFSKCAKQARTPFIFEIKFLVLIDPLSLVDVDSTEAGLQVFESSSISDFDRIDYSHWN